MISQDLCARGCGRPRRGEDQSYCSECHAAYTKKWRNDKKPKPSNDALTRARARAYANTYKRRGLLIERPCFCGAKAKIRIADPAKPLEVEWRCDKHERMHRAKALA